MEIKFKDIMNILKNDDETPFMNYTVEDGCSKQIHAEDLLVTEFNAMRDWPVASVCIDEYGRATIVLDGMVFLGFKSKQQ